MLARRRKHCPFVVKEQERVRDNMHGNKIVKVKEEVDGKSKYAVI